MRHRLLPTILTFALLISSSAAHAAVTFTGHAGTDFPIGACIIDPTPFDPNGQDVQFVVGSAIRVSGFDVTKLCILYDTASDSLLVGTLTHNNASNTDIITSDADGNGDPATVASDLIGSGVDDIANFGPQEYFSLVFDFNFYINDGLSIVIGKGPTAPFANYGVFDTASTLLDDANSPAMYGAAVGAALGSSTFAQPSFAQPHLEFTVSHFKTIPGVTLDWTDPNDTVGLYFTMGSHSDGLIGDETFPSKNDVRYNYGLYPLTVAHLLQIDADGDGVIDDVDSDDDNDGIPDIIENGLKACDLNGDGVLSVSQDLNNNGIFDAGEEGEIQKCTANGFNSGGGEIVRKAAMSGGNYVDTDGDGIPNYLDTDSDADGVLDKDEDPNGNGIVDPNETNPLDPDTNHNGIPDGIEHQKYLIDTDSDGLSDGEEADTYKTDPTNPDTDADGLKDGDEVKLYGTDPLKADTDGGGARDGLEVQKGTNPLDPSDDQKALFDPNTPFTDPTTATSPGGTDAGSIDPNLAGYTTDQVQVSGSGLGSCSLVSSPPLMGGGGGWVIGFSFILLVVFRFLSPPPQPSPIKGEGVIKWLIVVFCILLANPVYALNAQRQHLPMNGNGGIFQDNSQMLGQYHWNIQMGFDYTKRPLQFSLISSGAQLDTIVKYFLTQDTSVAFGLADWLDVSVAVQSNIPSSVQPIGTVSPTTQADFGDVLVSAKFLLMDPVEQKYGIGLAIIPFVTLPSGNSNRYFGAGNMTGGFKVIGEHYFGRTNAYMTLGADFFPSEDFLNLTTSSDFLFGIGAQHPISVRHDLIILGEFDGSTAFKKFMHQQVTSPVEMNGGFRKYWFDRHLAATVSAGAGLDSGYGSPQLRVLGALSWFSHSIKDRDDDRVLDPGDYCPTQIEDPNNPGTKPGCPDPKVIVKVVGDRILILRPINFETGSATITADSVVVVDQIAQLLKSAPELKKILVEGHTDNVGGPAYNLNLSETRAKAVVTALVARGVAANRLESRGWGYTRPLTNNVSEVAKAKNRRVEFHIIEFAKQ